MAWKPDYVDESELKSYLRIDDPRDDPELRFAISAASRAIDHATNRQFGNLGSVEQRTYEVVWNRTHSRWQGEIDDLQTLTGLVVTASSTALTSTQYQLYPLNAAENGRPYTRIRVDSATSPASGSGPCTIAVDADFGWSAVPDAIKEATLVQASRFFKRRDAPFGVAGSPDLGSEIRLLNRTDPDVDVMVRDFRRNEPRL